MLFFIATLIIIGLSMVLSHIQFGYVHPLTGEPIQVRNLLTASELLTLVSSMVKNFASFPPLGVVIVATLGIGIAEGSGYITTALKKLLAVVPQSAVTPSVIFIGIVAHIASDSAYVVLMPVSAYIFYKSGKHPLAGIAAGFAGSGRWFHCVLHPFHDRSNHGWFYRECRPDFRPILCGQCAVQLLLLVRLHLCRAR